MIRHALIFWSAVALAIVGFLTGLLDQGIGSLRNLLFPLLLLAVVFYAYKIAPARSARSTSSSGSKTQVKPSQKTMAKVAGKRKGQGTSGKRKSYPFQVIEGSKGKNDENLPKYH
ncbi:hypothetical protein [Paenibacillus monticola]|uniref:Uncharacterized protein n=1 Tax=Paenibacillus monticola TaxID=2666075 RepID=A0A7X2L1V5_9BACL|nr:hypothetical protein [Paenibacillus monticola]MRN53573.1 hypothetical protein [Paenibacillus monticola]